MLPLSYEMDASFRSAECDIAWAAGLFDAEGSASSHLWKRRQHAQPELFVYQAGRDMPPEVLVCFQEILQCGSVLGPYRGRLWCWRASRVADVVEVATRLWPWLGPVKREQFSAVGTRVSNPTLTEALDDLEGSFCNDWPLGVAATAWAAGFFVGEGWISCRLPTPSNRYSQLRLGITQASRHGVPAALERFRAAMDGLGSVLGPYVPTSPWSRQPQYRWQIGNERGARIVIRSLWPWLDQRKRAQATAALSALHASRTSRRV
jgi:hypothetical protein